MVMMRWFNFVVFGAIQLHHELRISNLLYSKVV